MVVFGLRIADYIPAETMISIDGAEMILVPTGEFKMGTSEAEIDLLTRDFAGKEAKRSWFEAETPQHVVYTDKFYIDVTEVTNRMYAKFLNDRTQNADEFGHQLLDLNSDHVLIEFVDGRYRPKGGFENHPVIEVTWYGAAAYCRWVGKQLPTEAQWEKAARGGLVGGRYPWGDQFSSDNVRDMGRASYGVTGIKMDGEDKVVSLEIIKDPSSSILTITSKGYGKRSKIDDYRKTGRAGKGVINLKINEKTGDVVDTINVNDGDKFVVSTKKGIVIRTGVKDIRVMGRATSGVRIIKLGVGDRVSAIAKLVKDEIKVVEEEK